MNAKEHGKKAKKLPYRKGVGAVLFNDSGKVLVAMRLDKPGKYWQMPQGGIDKSEKPKKALMRELYEEIGVKENHVIILKSIWLAYDLPSELMGTVWNGRYRGQRQKWFALKFTGKDSDIDLNTTDHPEFSRWKWVDVKKLPLLAIPFKRQLYERISDQFSGLSNHER